MYNLQILTYPKNNEMEIRKYLLPIVSTKKSEEFEENITPGYDPKKALLESMRRSKEMIYRWSRANVWEYFALYSFDQKKVDRSDYDQCYRSLKNHFKNLRDYYSQDIKYIMVPELHKDGKNWHFHALISNIGNTPLEKAINAKTGKLLIVKGKQVYNIKPFKQGFSSVIRIGSGESGRVSNYLSKYITKALIQKTKGRQRYMISKNLDPPEIQKMLVTDDQYTLIWQTYIKNTASVKTVYLDKNGVKNEIQYLQVKFNPTDT